MSKEYAEDVELLGKLQRICNAMLGLSNVFEQMEVTPAFIDRMRELMKDAEVRVPDLREKSPGIHADLDALEVLLRRFEFLKDGQIRRN